MRRGAYRYRILDCEGRLGEAPALCDGRIASDGSDVSWINAKANILNQMGRTGDQVKLYVGAHRNLRKDSDWWAGRARALVAVGRLNEAEEIALKMAGEERRPGVACVALGEVLMARGDRKGAINLFNKASDINEFD